MPNVEQRTDEAAVGYVVNISDIRMIVDNMAHDCDHTTYVAKVLGPADESGERIDIPVGRICVKKKTWFFTEIKHIIVREEFRRQGIAKFMINYLINDVNVETGDKIIFTTVTGGTVNSENVPTIQLLTLLGFTHATSFHNPATGNNIMFMVKSLSPIIES